MIRLLTEGLKRNEGLEEITVVNQSGLTPEWRNKLSRFFTPVVLTKTLWYLQRNSRQFIIEGSGNPNVFPSLESQRLRVM
jgi:hypothetical protein